MSTLLHQPFFVPSRRLGVPVAYLWLAALWYGYFATTVFVGIGASHGAMLVAMICYVLILFRPPREIPLALLTLSTVSVDQLIFLGPVLVLCRLLIRQDLLVTNAATTRVFFLFAFSAALSVLIGYTTVEFRPFQTLFWSITLLAPLALLFLRLRDRDESSFKLVFTYVLYLAALQFPVLFMQGLKTPQFARGDTFAGTWINANIVGFWGATLCGGALLFFLERRGRGAHTGKATRAAMGILLVGFVMGFLADAKAYSGTILLATTLVLLTILLRRSMRSLPYGFAILVLIGMISWGGVHLTRAYIPVVKTWGTPILEKSQKVIFLRRVFLEIHLHYNQAFGVGPGMLGSRAANVVSGDVLYKEKTQLPGFFTRAPAPERWGMEGLWGEELFEQMRWTSATLTFPFSGLGAIKGELGWTGLTLFCLLICMTAILHITRRGDQESAFLIAAEAAIGIALLGNLFLCVFDTVWEMPKITVFLGALCLALPASRDSDTTAAAGPSTSDSRAS